MNIRDHHANRLGLRRKWPSPTFLVHFAAKSRRSAKVIDVSNLRCPKKTVAHEALELSLHPDLRSGTHDQIPSRLIVRTACPWLHVTDSKHPKEWEVRYQRVKPLAQTPLEPRNIEGVQLVLGIAGSWHQVRRKQASIEVPAIKLLGCRLEGHVRRSGEGSAAGGAS